MAGRLLGVSQESASSLGGGQEEARSRPGVGQEFRRWPGVGQEARSSGCKESRKQGVQEAKELIGDKLTIALKGNFEGKILTKVDKIIKEGD